MSFENVDNDALSRGVQRPDAQDLIDAGVAGVGADSPFNDSPLVQTWGRAETSANRFSLMPDLIWVMAMRLICMVVMQKSMVVIVLSIVKVMSQIIRTPMKPL